MSFFDSMMGRGSGRGKALNFYKRGMVKAKKHDHDGAIGDYSAAIELSDAPPDVKAMALYNRALVHAAAKDSTRAVEDLKALLSMAELPPNIKTAADEKLKKINRRVDHGSAAES